MKHAPIIPHGKAPHDHSHQHDKHHVMKHAAGGHEHHSAHFGKHAAGHMLEQDKVVKLCGGGMYKK
jgi:hypothetical protein